MYAVTSIPSQASDDLANIRLLRVFHDLISLPVTGKPALSTFLASIHLVIKFTTAISY
jgi:hypothetical protein